MTDFDDQKRVEATGISSKHAEAGVYDPQEDEFVGAQISERSLSWQRAAVLLSVCFSFGLGSLTR